MHFSISACCYVCRRSRMAQYSVFLRRVSACCEDPADNDCGGAYYSLLLTRTPFTIVWKNPHTTHHHPHQQRTQNENTPLFSTTAMHTPKKSTLQMCPFLCVCVCCLHRTNLWKAALVACWKNWLAWTRKK